MSLPSPSPPLTRVEARPSGDRDGVFRDVLARTVRHMDAAGIPWLLMGGVASTVLGRPRWTHDIDLFVSPRDAESALNVLAGEGFETEKTDPVWLFKGFADDILVDVIFCSAGDIYLDREMLEHAVDGEFEGVPVRVIGREDLVFIKAMAFREETSRHWYDALALLAAGGMNWEYFLHRALRHPRRLLSLLLFAQSVDLAVPHDVVDRLFAAIHGPGLKLETP